MAEPVRSLLDDLPGEEDMRKLIECPICMEIPLPPIYLCNMGHIVCNSCQERTYACPLCRERYCSTRSFVAEGIVEKCNLRCKYAEFGCPLVMKGSDMVDHVPLCDYRPVNCHECRNKLINYNEYLDHLFKQHKILGAIDNEAYIAYRMNLNHTRSFIERCFWPQYYMKAYEKTFMVRLSTNNIFLSAWICLLGPKSECENYTALIEFQLINNEAVKYSWSGPINHFREDPNRAIIAEGRGLPIPLETIMGIAAVSSNWAEWIYRVKIYEKSDSTLEDACEEGRKEMTSPFSRPVTSGSRSRKNTPSTRDHLTEEDNGIISNIVNAEGDSSHNNTADCSGTTKSNEFSFMAELTASSRDAELYGLGISEDDTTDQDWD